MEAFPLPLLPPPIRHTASTSPIQPIPFLIGSDPSRQPIPGATGEPGRLADQRFVDNRPDVLTFVSAPLDHDVTVTGALSAFLYASTSGTDSDFVTKLIDVYPESAQKTPGIQRKVQSPANTPSP